jgi:hypothetical protein
MKKHLLLSVIGIAASIATAASSHAQGSFNLDNYDSIANPSITYGAGYGPTLYGTGLVNGTGAAFWTVGFYYALGDVTGSIMNDPTGMADPSTLGGGLVFGSGAPGGGDSTTFNVSGHPGYFATVYAAVIPGFTSGKVTLEMVVFDGANYDGSTVRAHSIPFTMTPATGTQSLPLVGNFMPAFSVVIIPEPSLFAFAGLGLAAVFVRRAAKMKKQSVGCGSTRRDYESGSRYARPAW